MFNGTKSEKTNKILIKAHKELNEILKRYRLEDFEDWSAALSIRTGISGFIKALKKAGTSNVALTKDSRILNMAITLSTWMILECYYSRVKPDTTSLYFSMYWLEKVLNVYIFEFQGADTLQSTFLNSEAQEITDMYLATRGFSTTAPTVLGILRIQILNIHTKEAQKAVSALLDSFGWLAIAEQSACFCRGYQGRNHW